MHELGAYKYVTGTLVSANGVRGLTTIVVLAAAFPLFCSSAGPLDAARSSYPSADDVRKIYEGVLQKNKAILKSVGRHIHGTFAGGLCFTT